MIKGGISERRCKTCKLNGNQHEYNCGYIYTEETCNKDITFEFPELNDINQYTHLCPIWYYNEYEHLYSVLNLYREDISNIHTFPIRLRLCILSMNNYMNNLLRYNTKK